MKQDVTQDIQAEGPVQAAGRDIVTVEVQAEPAGVCLTVAVNHGTIHLGAVAMRACVDCAPVCANCHSRPRE